MVPLGDDILVMGCLRVYVFPYGSGLLFYLGFLLSAHVVPVLTICHCAF